MKPKYYFIFVLTITTIYMQKIQCASKAKSAPKKLAEEPKKRERSPSSIAIDSLVQAGFELDKEPKKINFLHVEMLIAEAENQLPNISNQSSKKFIEVDIQHYKDKMKKKQKEVKASGEEWVVEEIE